MPKLTDAEWAAKREQLATVAKPPNYWPALDEPSDALKIEELWLVIRRLVDHISKLEERAGGWSCPDCGVVWFDGKTGRTSACPHRIEPGDNAEPPLGD